MRSYKVLVEETVAKEITVKADNAEDAKRVAEQMYMDEKIVFDCDDLTGTIDVSTWDE